MKIFLNCLFIISLFTQCGYYTQQSSRTLFIDNSDEKRNFKKNCIGITYRYNSFRLKYLSKEILPDTNFENPKNRFEYYKKQGIYETRRELGSGHGEIVEFEILDSNPSIKIKRIYNNYDGMILHFINESGTKVSPRVKIKTNEDQFTIKINCYIDTVIPASYSFQKQKKGKYLEINPINYLGKLFSGLHK